MDYTEEDERLLRSFMEEGGEDAEAAEEEAGDPTENGTGTNFKTPKTEGYLEHKNVLLKRTVGYDCCFQTNLIFIAVLAGILQGYQIGIIAGTELLIGD